jgi:hypothetical protein
MIGSRLSKPACSACCRWGGIASVLLGAALLAFLAGRAELSAQDPQSPSSETALPPDLQAVPADAAFLLSARVAELWNSEAGTALRQQNARELASGLKMFEKDIGAAPEEIDRATVVLGDFKSQAPLVFITTTKPYDRARILTSAFSGAEAEKRHEQIFFVSEKKRAVFFINERSYLASSAEAVRSFLDRPSAKEGPLSAALQAAAGKHQIVGGFNVPAFAREAGQKLPPQMEAFNDLLKARSATWSIDLAGQKNAGLRLHFANDTEAKQAEKPLRAAIDLIRAGVAQGIQSDSQQSRGGASYVDLLKQLDAALRTASIEQKGTQLQVTLTIKTDAAVVAAAVQGVQKIRESANRQVDANNLKQIALAMHNYHDAYGHFPPQAVYSKEGKPLLSWRVLLLPFLEQDNLYRQFKLDEAWDSPHNKTLLAQMPKVYADPAVDPHQPETVYQGFAGPGAFFEGTKGLQIKDFTDGTSNTLMIVEAAVSVPWTKPHDLPYDPNKPLPKMGGHRSGVFAAAFCDGSVRFLPEGIKESVLRALITRNGGEVVDPRDN